MTERFGPNVIFDRAREIASPEDRRAYLDEACGDNAELRRRVEALLQGCAEAGSSFNRPEERDTASTATPRPRFDPQSLATTLGESAGSYIGRYKLLQKIGEGGMGVVFMAEQQEPVRRLVALKVIKAGMDTAQVLARFEAERQALALMDHPHIARVLDAGTTKSGRPYFVMEVVKGMPITTYCDEQRLTLRQRLELFVPVCQAIQHAHQKGIIHRDLKPSNVLVASYDGKPMPKVIDFGVAKATGQKLTERTLFTGLGALVGTLEYMSPEQAEVNPLDIDTRSDIYSLGVLLYEMLTGTTPLTRRRLKEASLIEVLRLIREEEPPRPSTRLTETKETLASTSAQRQVEPAALVRATRGEVDWIVMKALEKDRNRRYETANGLARDIQRYLTEEPVEAGPPGATYRLRKLAWKHRRGLATAAAVLLLVVAGSVASAALAAWALKERDRAVKAENVARMSEADAKAERDRAVKAESVARTSEQDAKAERDHAVKAEIAAKRSDEDNKAVLGFFQRRVLQASRPRNYEGGQGREVTLLQAVQAAEPGIAQAFKDRPLVEAAIRSTIGLTYWFAGYPAQAVKQQKRALELREKQLGFGHPDTIQSRGDLAQAYRAAGNTAEALRLFEQNLPLQTALAPHDAETLRLRGNLANTYGDFGRFDDSIRLHKENLEERVATIGVDHPDTLISRNNLGKAYYLAERLGEAVPMLEQNLKLGEAKLGDDHALTLTFRHNLAEAYLLAGRTSEAIRLSETTLKQRQRVLGDTHPATLATRDQLGRAYSAAGRNAEAIAMLEQTLKLRQNKLGANHPDTLDSRRDLAEAYLSAGRTADAIRLVEQAYQRQRAEPGPERRDVLPTQELVGRCYLAAHRYADAEAVLRGCLKEREAKQPDAWATWNTRSLLGAALLGEKKLAEAEPLLLSGYDGLKQRETKILPLKRNEGVVRKAAERLVKLYEATGQKDRADKWRQQVSAPASTAKK